MNRKGNIMINLLFFFMALVVVIVFIGPMKEILNIAQNSENLNCKGYIENGNANNRLSFNQTLNANASGSPIACLSIKLYMPYILLVFLITGIAKVLYDRSDMFGMNQPVDTGGY